MHSAALAFAVAIAPSVLLAQEEPTQRIDCKITKSCAPNGDCVSVGTNVTFDLKSRSEGYADEGPVKIEYGDISTKVGGSPMSGTYIWSESGDDVQFLQLLGSAGQDAESFYATWTQIQDIGLSGTVLFLTCRSD
jgi:hypothetical protein